MVHLSSTVARLLENREEMEGDAMSSGSTTTYTSCGEGIWGRLWLLVEVCGWLVDIVTCLVCKY